MPRGYVPEAGDIVWLKLHAACWARAGGTPTGTSVESARVQRENKPDGLLSDDNTD